MIFFLALLPATMLTMVGYVVIYVANRSEGGLKTFGKYLGFWAFTLAALLMLCSLICAARGGPMRHMHMMMHEHAGDMPPGQQPPPWREPTPGATPGTPGAPASSAAPAAPPAPK
jgi:hypothetical protein